MRIRLTTLLITFILTATTFYGQTYEPLDLAKKIFGKDYMRNIDKYCKGEYKGKPNGKDIQKGLITNFNLLEQTDKNAVVRMTILDSIGNGVDTYLHFEKDNLWKMTAFRGLAMTGLIEQMRIELEKMTSQQVDDIIAESKNKKEDSVAMFTSKDDYYFQLGNAKLTLEIDDNIVKHFLANLTEFEKLKNFALKQLENEKVDNERSIQLIEDLKPEYQKLFISSVSTGGYQLGNCINFLIGGMLDNTVGYIYVMNKKDLPEMNPSRIIMIKEIGNGWYIYKTT